MQHENPLNAINTRFGSSQHLLDCQDVPSTSLSLVFILLLVVFIVLFMITRSGAVIVNYGAALLRLESRTCWEAAFALDVAFAIISVVKLPQVRVCAPSPTMCATL
jgi:hypothetical protein